jgi:ribosome-binding factor A
MPSNRSKKVATQIKNEIGNLLQTQIKDPLIGFVTITNVLISDDLRNAKVYFSVLGDSKQKNKSIQGLNRARTYIQSEIGSKLGLRYVPIVNFYIDETLEYQEHINELLKSLDSTDMAGES